MKELESMFVEAERKNLWFYARYQNLWFSPRELRNANENGTFLWGPVNWTLHDPQERIQELQSKIQQAEDDLARFRDRLAKGKTQ